MHLMKNWRQKLGALLVATAIWYLIKMHLRRRGTIPPVYDFVPGQVELAPDRNAEDRIKEASFII
mgnify:CR=1 FL=1